MTRRANPHDHCKLTVQDQIQAQKLDTRGVAMLLEALNLPCGCESGWRHAECAQDPLVRWWLCTEDNLPLVRRLMRSSPTRNSG